MTRHQIEAHQLILLEQRTRILRDLHLPETPGSRPDDVPEDVPDGSTTVQAEMDVTERDRLKIMEIDHALGKIARGIFGVCEWPDCRAEIGQERLNVLPTARMCVEHQRQLERMARTGDPRPPQRFFTRDGVEYVPEKKAPDAAGPVFTHGADLETDLEEEMAAQVEFREDVVVVGEWSGDLSQVAQEALKVRTLLAEGRAAEARKEMRNRPSEEKAAMVMVSPAGREDLLSLTGPGGKGYGRDVVDRLSTEAIIDLLVVESEYLKYNGELLRAMSPACLARAVRESLEPVIHWEARQRVAWEWLEALAEVGDVAHRAILLTAMDPSLIEDALMGIVDELDLGGLVSPISGVDPVPRFRAFSESGLGGLAPSRYLENQQIGRVLDALADAAPEVFFQAVRGAWERTSGRAEEIEGEGDDNGSA